MRARETAHSTEKMVARPNARPILSQPPPFFPSGIGVGCGFGIGWGFGGAPIGFAGLGVGGGCGVGLLALGWGAGFALAGSQYLPATATFSSRPSLLEKVGRKVREAKEHGARVE